MQKLLPVTPICLAFWNVSTVKIQFCLQIWIRCHSCGIAAERRTKHTPCIELAQICHCGSCLTKELIFQMTCFHWKIENWGPRGQGVHPFDVIVEVFNLFSGRFVVRGLRGRKIWETPTSCRRIQLQMCASFLCSLKNLSRVVGFWDWIYRKHTLLWARTMEPTSRLGGWWLRKATIVKMSTGVTLCRGMKSCSQTNDKDPRTCWLIGLWEDEPQWGSSDSFVTCTMAARGVNDLRVNLTPVCHTRWKSRTLLRPNAEVFGQQGSALGVPVVFLQHWRKIPGTLEQPNL